MWCKTLIIPLKPDFGICSLLRSAQVIDNWYFANGYFVINVLLKYLSASNDHLKYNIVVQGNKDIARRRQTPLSAIFYTEK